MKKAILLLLALAPLLSEAGTKAPLPPMVNKVSRLKFEVSKSRMERDLKDPQSQLATFSVMPSLGMGYMSGLSVSHFSKSCLLPAFGIQDGDVIETVNGQQLGGLGDITEVGQKLAKAHVGSKIRVNIKRGDEDIVQNYLIVD
jgi:S1-C subfamily serine protease